MSTDIQIPSSAPKSRSFAFALRAWCTHSLPRWVRYAYFLRFSLILWFLPFALIWANSPYHARALTSGIVTPTTVGQYLCASFFLIAASFVSLVLARIVVINGEERLGEHPPLAVQRLLADNRARREWIAPAASQLNNLIFFGYMVVNGRGEGVLARTTLTGILLGAVVAFLFWYSLTAFYYLTFRPHATAPGGMRLAKTAARTLLFPRSFLFLTSHGGGEPCFGDALEDAVLPLPVNWIARFFPVRGYRWRPDGALYEAHYFSVIAAFGFFGLYLILWPLTAPILLTRASIAALIVQVAVGLWLYSLVLRARLPGTQSPDLQPLYQRNLRLWKILLAVPILGYTLAVPVIYYAGDAERFPILALVLILLISLTWIFGAIAFYADRYRIPVLTVFLVLLLLPRILEWTGAREEHYLSVKMMPAAVTLPTPGAILAQKLAAQPQPSAQPAHPPTFIIVTSTGGGIHAAGWTTAVLARLEQAFAGPQLTSFHDHVLLLSTVSGGSAGLYAYMRELDPATNGGQPEWDRMIVGARCSSLEAIGWGLVYYDIPKAIVPLFPGLVPPSSGIDDLARRPLFMDRTWGLRRAMLRNLDDPWCRLAIDNSHPAITRKSILDDQRANPDADQKLTLASLSATDPAHPFPAFTMNTTTVEQGDRFLLANYRVPPNPPDIRNGVNYSIEPEPADSFLQAYGGLHPANDTRVADLPLATAAQLSATFPYVSSSATFPEVKDKETAHFVDGGYYDNDGTASAIEFIRSALDENPRGPRIRILLVEIRNSADATYGVKVNELPTPVEDNSRKGCHPWNLADQLSAPAKAFYSAGHGSVTDRNRNALVLLERAYADRLDLRHFIIDDRTNGTDSLACVPNKVSATDPLNWALTPRQQHEIDASAALYADKYRQIRACFATGDQCPRKNEESTAVAGSPQ